MDQHFIPQTVHEQYIPGIYGIWMIVIIRVVLFHTPVYIQVCHLVFTWRRGLPSDQTYTENEVNWATWSNTVCVEVSVKKESLVRHSASVGPTFADDQTVVLVLCR